MNKLRIAFYLLFGAILTIIWFGVVMHQSAPEYQNLIIGDKVFPQEVGVALWFMILGVVGVLLSIFENRIFSNNEKVTWSVITTWFWGFPIGSFLTMLPLMLINLDVLIVSLLK
jgi:hypothetical protein